jgi:hypothetical protein
VADTEIDRVLGALIAAWRGTPELHALTTRLVEELAHLDEPFVGAPLPPRLVDGRLPSGVASAWVFVLRAGTRNPAHLHPNSTQRTAVLSGTGSCFVGGRERVLEAFDAARPEVTLYTFPAGMAHAFLPGFDPLVVLSFHSVPPDQLVEVEVETHRTRTYLG